MKPLNTGSPDPSIPDETVVQGAQAVEEPEDVFDPTTGSSAAAGPGHQDHDLGRPVVKDLPKES